MLVIAIVFLAFLDAPVSLMILYRADGALVGMLLSVAVWGLCTLFFLPYFYIYVLDDEDLSIYGKCGMLALVLLLVNSSFGLVRDVFSTCATMPRQ